MCIYSFRVSALVAGLIFILTAPASADDTWIRKGAGWSQYTNERFGTVADVPHHLFDLIAPPPDNGDGRTLASKDGAQIRIFGSYGPYAVTKTFGEYKKWLLDNEREDGRRVTYTAQGETWIVVSGTDAGAIFYERTIEGCGAAHTFSIEYPASRKAVYDPLVRRIARSLRCVETKRL